MPSCPSCFCFSRCRLRFGECSGSGRRGGRGGCGFGDGGCSRHTAHRIGNCRALGDEHQPRCARGARLALWEPNLVRIRAWAAWQALACAIPVLEIALQAQVAVHLPRGELERAWRAGLARALSRVTLVEARVARLTRLPAPRPRLLRRCASITQLALAGAHPVLV